MYSFAISVVDYGGPFILKDRKGRACKKYKTYMSFVLQQNQYI